MNAVLNPPYHEMDEPIIRLCKAINALPGIRTIGSCGGHEEGGELPADRWHVSLKVDVGEDERPTYAGWLSLEFLAWALNDLSHSDLHIDFLALASPPYLNDPGHMLMFSIEASRAGEGGIEANDGAEWIERWIEELFWPYAAELIPEAAR